MLQDFGMFMRADGTPEWFYHASNWEKNVYRWDEDDYIIASQFPIPKSVPLNVLRRFLNRTSRHIYPMQKNVKDRPVYELVLPSDLGEPSILSKGATADERILRFFHADLFFLPEDANLQRYASHQLMYTNPSTGKSFMAKATGIRFDSATTKSLMGFASANDVCSGTLKGLYGTTISLDEVVQAAGEELYSQLLSAMEGDVAWSKGKTSEEYQVSSPIRFMGNPPEDDLSEDEQRRVLYSQFDAMLRKLSKNTRAYGRRIAGVLFGLDYTASNAASPNSEDEYMRKLALSCERIKNMPVLIKAYKEKQDWLCLPLPDEYLKQLEEYASKAQTSLIKRFLYGQKESRTHARGMALRMSIANPDAFEKEEDALVWLLHENSESFKRILDVESAYAKNTRIEYWRTSTPSYLGYFFWNLLHEITANKSKVATWDALEVRMSGLSHQLGLSKPEFKRRVIAQLQGSFREEFKVNSDSIEVLDAGVLNVVYSHKFDNVKWKLDNATNV